VVPPLLEHVGRKYLETANEDLTVRLRRKRSRSSTGISKSAGSTASRGETGPKAPQLRGSGLRHTALSRSVQTLAQRRRHVFGFVSSGGLSDALMRGSAASSPRCSAISTATSLPGERDRSQANGGRAGGTTSNIASALPLAQPRIELSSDASHADAPIAPGHHLCAGRFIARLTHHEPSTGAALFAAPTSGDIDQRQ